jgi:hypothetical protein
MGDSGPTTGAGRSTQPDSRLAAHWELVTLAAVMLAGCQTAPIDPRAGASASAGGTESAAVAPAMPSAQPAILPASVMGLNRGAIRKLLGEPGVIRRDEPAEVWQYRTAACILDLFLYDEAHEPRVVYAEARTPAAEPAPTGNCLSDVAAKRRPLSNS